MRLSPRTAKGGSVVEANKLVVYTVYWRDYWNGAYYQQRMRVYSRAG
ncbi:hypothetical protein GCM10022421_10180 [Oceanisphaera sediminis]|uniref:Uncharacterized protein n=1 Tax=Oceanisphaera sediminis TaxID=981381 RepID=A0ABP7DJZ7_9GAMM